MIIGVSGGTGSGKTTVAHRIMALVGSENVAYLQQDSYYRDLGDTPLDLRNTLNFDHPDALDTALLVTHLKALNGGESVDQPIYDFANHSRKSETITLLPKPIILVEGILVLASFEIRSLLDLKIFVDTDEESRFSRRLIRDVSERGRAPESVRAQCETTVRPMHLQFVEPSRRYADIVISEGGFNDEGIARIVEKIHRMLRAQEADQIS